MRRPLPSRVRLLTLLRYDPLSGVLLWRRRPEETSHDRSWNTRYADAPALASLCDAGYLEGRIDGALYRQHRVIWKMETGEEPERIDHENGRRNDNRWRNLRAVNSVEHAQNSGVRIDNTSGVVGVSYDKKAGRWRAQITFEGKNKYLGNFLHKHEAISARRQAEEGCGYHPNHGKREGFRACQ